MIQENEGRASLLTLAFAVTGALKLAGLEKRLFARWGLSSRQMRRVGAIEVLGAAMVSQPATRSLGAAGLAAISAVTLGFELRNRETELILPRLGLLTLAALTFAAAAQAKRGQA